MLFQDMKKEACRDSTYCVDLKISLTFRGKCWKMLTQNKVSLTPGYVVVERIAELEKELEKYKDLCHLKEPRQWFRKREIERLLIINKEIYHTIMNEEPVTLQ